MSPRPTPAQITARLEAVSRASDLDARTRLSTKIDMSPEAIAHRLREVADLLDLCAKLRAATAGRPESRLARSG